MELGAGELEFNANLGVDKTEGLPDVSSSSKPFVLTINFFTSVTLGVDGSNGSTPADSTKGPLEASEAMFKEQNSDIDVYR